MVLLRLIQELCKLIFILISVGRIVLGQFFSISVCVLSSIPQISSRWHSV